jgi:hypothetical protein
MFPSIVNPKSRERRAFRMAFADATKDFVGMQPVFKQTPPKLAFSMMQVGVPLRAAFMAPT